MRPDIRHFAIAAMGHELMLREGFGRRTVNDANATDATALKTAVTTDCFGLANGTVALDSPDIANTIKTGLHRERAGGLTGRRRASSGSHGRAF